MIDSVKIEYTIDNGNSWTTIIKSTPGTGFYQWNPIPNIPSNLARIRISDAADGTPSAVSDSVFSIPPQPPLNVITPGGGETWISGSKQTIRWNSLSKIKPGGNQIQKYLKGSPYFTQTIANIKIEFTTNDGSTWSTIIASTPNNGSYDWNPIPSLNSSLCRIKISDADQGVPFAISKNFVITNQIVKTLTLLSPVGGETWDVGTSHNITWTATSVNAVKIEFTSNNGIDWNLIVASVSGSGSYTWSIPDINSTLCKVRISDATDGSSSDVSGNVFTIKPVSTIAVTAPAAGDVYVAGDPVNIRWTSTGIQNVKIEYTTNNGLLNTDWHSLVDNTPSNGLFVSSFSIPTNQYRVRISEALTGSPMAYSNGVFTVSPQPVRTVTVTSPNGGENWLVGTTNEIRWVSTNIDSVKLEYTIDGGAVWNTIIASTPSNGLYNWNIPNTSFRSDLCQIRVSNTKRAHRLIFPMAISQSILILNSLDGCSLMAANLFAGLHYNMDFCWMLLM